MFFLALWIEHRSAVELPPPTGPFAVGRALFDWKDASHEVLAWIWYPAENGGTVDDYVPRSLPRVPPGRANVFTLLTRDASKVRAHSLRDAALSSQQRQYPVVIFRGGASSEVRNYSTLTEDLASHGYVVVGIDAPGRTGLVVFPDGRVVYRAPENNPELFSGAGDRGFARLLAAWDADIAFALDRLAQLDGQFAGRLDMNRVGVFGHSFGGAQAAQFCADDARCKAGVDVDGLLLGDVVAKGIHKPFMFVLSDHGDDAESRKVKADIQSVYARLPPDARRIVVIPGANHFMFSDDGAVLKSHVLRGVMRLFGVLKIDARRQVAITTNEIHGFFDAHLRSAAVSAAGRRRPAAESEPLSDQPARTPALR